MKDHGAPTRIPANTSLVTTKDLLWMLYLFPLRLLALAIPPRGLYTLGRVLAPPFRLTVRSQRQRARTWMGEAFPAGTPPEALDHAANQFVDRAVLRALDDLHLSQPGATDRLPAPEIEGRDHLDAALAAGRGVLLVSGHFYANRLAKLHLRREGYPVMSVRNARPPDRWMGRLGRALLQPRYIQFLHGVIRDEVHTQDPQCTLKIFQRLRSGGIVNVHMDAAFASHRQELPFLGRKRRFGTGLLEIIRLSNCTVLPMECHGNQRHVRIRFGAPIGFTPSAGRQEFIENNLPLLKRRLEQMILTRPEEWELWARL
jgi:KDO2-lipid IV(A) lauroyltransferase